MSSPDLTCVELVELVTDYLEGALSPADGERFEQHLDACNGCTAYVEQFREAIRLTGVLRESDVSPEARGALLAEFAGWKRGRG
jgi:anti-sigma factor RsiW